MTPARQHRSPRLTAAAIALATFGAALAGCSSDGGSAGNQSATASTSLSGSTAPETGPTTEPPPTADPPDPDQFDVEDAVFSGLGDPRIDVDHYDVTVRADPGDPKVTGTVIITLAALTAEPLPTFTLDLRGPEITSATLDGSPVEVATHQGDRTLQVELTPAEPLQP
ncbi:MAG: hypothetical protein ABI239_07715, partial [Aquihabitans sp.]